METCLSLAGCQFFFLSLWRGFLCTYALQWKEETWDWDWVVTSYLHFPTHLGHMSISQLTEDIAGFRLTSHLVERRFVHIQTQICGSKFMRPDAGAAKGFEAGVPYFLGLFFWYLGIFGLFSRASWGLLLIFSGVLKQIQNYVFQD